MCVGLDLQKGEKENKSICLMRGIRLLFEHTYLFDWSLFLVFGDTRPGRPLYF